MEKVNYLSSDILDELRSKAKEGLLLLKRHDKLFRIEAKTRNNIRILGLYFLL